MNFDEGITACLRGSCNDILSTSQIGVEKIKICDQIIQKYNNNILTKASFFHITILNFQKNKLILKGFC